MNPRLNFNKINIRIDDLLNFFYNYNQPNHCNQEKYQIVNLSLEGNLEGNLYLLFLETHFHSLKTAESFNGYLPWNKLENFAESEVDKSCKIFFEQTKVEIGDHRRNFRCMPISQKINYTVEILGSYKKVVNKYGSQKKFFEIDGKPEFDKLYERMKEIKHFNTRLPRFDHLEKLCRVNKFYCIPKRFYVEDASGPLDGLTYLILGLRFRGNKTQLKASLFSKPFLKDWNTFVKVQSEYIISQGESLKSAIQKLEHWTIDTVKKRLSPDKQKNPAFVFDLETNICNWQKRKK